jgi:hypothetical protein
MRNGSSPGCDEVTIGLHRSDVARCDILSNTPRTRHEGASWLLLLHILGSMCWAQGPGSATREMTGVQGAMVWASAWRVKIVAEEMGCSCAMDI